MIFLSAILDLCLTFGLIFGLFFKLFYVDYSQPYHLNSILFIPSFLFFTNSFLLFAQSYKYLNIENIHTDLVNSALAYFIFSIFIIIIYLKYLLQSQILPRITIALHPSLIYLISLSIHSQIILSAFLLLEIISINYSSHSPQAISYSLFLNHIILPAKDNKCFTVYICS